MAKVLSSISGNLISAASAGYAPTNSGDVSAIASGYQVVSATGTQLYAGTAHVTSINSAPISASRAGQAANASMANSAYYDGTGRLISALPDSAAVSSIASSYAPTFGLNGGKISSINGSALDTPTGGGVVTATGSGWIGGNIGVSSINGSSIYAVSAGRAYSDEYGTPIATYYAKQSSLTGVSSTVANNSASWGAVTGISSPSGTIVVNGGDIEGTNSAVLTASATGFSSTGYVFNHYISDGGILRLITDILPGTGGVLRMSADTPIYRADILLSGQDSASNFVTATATVSGETRDIVIPLGTIDRFISASASQYINLWQNDVYTAEKAGGVQVTGVAELAWKSAVDDVTNTVSSNSASWGGGGGVDSATVSAIASSYAESAVSSKADSSALSSYALSADVSAYRVVSSIGKAPDDMAMDGEVVTTINGTELRALKATYDGSGRYLTNLPDSAAVSAIASSYAESAVSAKADSSALSSYALSSDVSGTVDLVSTQSANWGGSALALSAGPGVKLEKVGNTLVAGLDETVLWSGTYQNTATGSIVLSESWKNFQKIEVYGFNTEGKVPIAGIYYTSPFSGESLMEVVVGTQGFATWGNPATYNVSVSIPCRFTSETAVDIGSAKYVGNWNSNWQAANNLNGRTYISKVVGVNRTAGV